MKPEIILFWEGGIIQSISANTDITVYNLDNDIMEDSVIEREGNTFNDRKFKGVDLEKNWKEFKQMQKEEWDGKLEEEIAARV